MDYLDHPDYQDFSVISSTDGTANHCRFRNLILAIAPRHSDTADIQFLVNGKPVIVALPMVAFAEFRNRHGRVITDEESIQIAGKLLKDLLEHDVLPDDRCLTPSAAQTLKTAEILASLSPAEHTAPTPKLVNK